MDINIKPNETMQSINGYNIAGSIDGLSVKVIEAGWWRVDHQLTDFFIIGKFTHPTIVKIDIKLSALFWLLNESCNAINPKYIKKSIRVEVILASHCHHVPQVGIPQTDPENNAKKVTKRPTNAADFVKYAANFTLQIRYIADQAAIIQYISWAYIEEGTCR